MRKNKLIAFTLIELMVSIFITITIIASFYKLYNASAKTERSTSIRVSVNLLGEQILDTISESMRLIGLNGSTGSDLSNDTTGILRGVLTGGWGTTDVSFSYVSPYGSPITKLADKATGTYPTCSFKLFNSAAFHSDINRLYVHNQDGVFVFSMADGSEPSYDNNSVTLTAGGALRSAVSVSSGTSCSDLFPAGSLVTGSDFIFNLTYTYPKTLLLSYTSMNADGTALGTAKNLINSNYDSASANNQSFQIPYFVLEFLRLYKNGDVEVREWVKTVDNAHSSEEGTEIREKSDVVAVRFGFVVLSLKDRVTAEDSSSATTMTNEYCIFDENSEDKQGKCYNSSIDARVNDPKYTVSVFRRVVYLANYRLLNDQAK